MSNSVPKIMMHQIIIDIFFKIRAGPLNADMDNFFFFHHIAHGRDNSGAFHYVYKWALFRFEWELA